VERKHLVPQAARQKFILKNLLMPILDGRALSMANLKQKALLATTRRLIRDIPTLTHIPEVSCQYYIPPITVSFAALRVSL